MGPLGGFAGGEKLGGALVADEEGGVVGWLLPVGGDWARACLA